LSILLEIAKMSEVTPQDINVAVLGQINHRQQYAPAETFSESLLGVDTIKSHTGYRFFKTDGPEQNPRLESNNHHFGSTSIAQDLQIIRMRIGDDEEYLKSQKELLSEICKHGKTNPYQKHDFDNVEVRNKRENFVFNEKKRKYEKEIQELRELFNNPNKREVLSKTAELLHRINKESKELYKDVLKE
ncbi:hypothetical protein BgiMline_019404, partial [Biomphalaria glabrata]